ICGLKHQKEKRSMVYFAGLDVSVKETSVCIVDDAGKIVREARVASEPEALLQVLTNNIDRLARVGLEAGPLSQWLYSALAEAGLPVICVETRHMRAMLKAQINKTDRNDARGLAQMMRVGLYRRPLPDPKIGRVNSPALEISPAGVVSRRASAWDGIRVEVVQFVTHDKIEFRSRAPCHLLLVYEEGVREEGETVVGDLPPSTLRTQQRIVATYIEEHLAEAISLHALAKLVHLSPYYFCRAFKQSFGIPPHRYHVNRRIERAKTLLAERESSVTGVALDVGFSETSSFSAAFRHTTGTTPTEYRRTLA